mmetsp:Transcript_8077/g.23063  ORF Transcript_8077/g.23063 Transcript_8077/m.23063 type:complete len:358 (-) Transcript_8077:247-1320(-)
MSSRCRCCVHTVGGKGPPPGWVASPPAPGGVRGIGGAPGPTRNPSTRRGESKATSGSRVLAGVPPASFHARLSRRACRPPLLASLAEATLAAAAAAVSTGVAAGLRARARGGVINLRPVSARPGRGGSSLLRAPKMRARAPPMSISSETGGCGSSARCMESGSRCTTPGRINVVCTSTGSALRAYSVSSSLRPSKKMAYGRSALKNEKSVSHSSRLLVSITVRTRSGISSSKPRCRTCSTIPAAPTPAPSSIVAMHITSPAGTYSAVSVAMPVNTSAPDHCSRLSASSTMRRPRWRFRAEDDMPVVLPVPPGMLRPGGLLRMLRPAPSARFMAAASSQQPQPQPMPRLEAATGTREP